MAQKATVCKAALQLADVDRAVYADRQLVLSIPRGDGMIPKQLSLTVYHAKASIRNLEVLRAPAKDGGPRK